MPFQACLPLACFGDDWLLVVELCLQLLTKWTIDCFQLVCLWGLLLRLRFCMQSCSSIEGNNICKMKVNREFNFLSNNIKITYSAFIKTEADFKMDCWRYLQATLNDSGRMQHLICVTSLYCSQPSTIDPAVLLWCCVAFQRCTV